MTTTREYLCQRIQPEGDPFGEMSHEQSYSSKFGPDWDSHHPWFDEGIERLRPTVIIEVGSFLGASAIHLASKLKEQNIDGCVICVDTWYGDRQLWSRPEHRRLMGFHMGRPRTYLQFMENVFCAGLEQYIIPLPMHSTGAARYLNDLGVRSSFIYIDGSHDEEDVYLDLKLYWDLLTVGGQMLIDDYVPNTNNNQMFWGLIKDVDRFARQRSLAIECYGRKARFTKE